MTRFSFCTLTLALCLAANAATVRTASETFVTNKIAAVIAAIPEPDFSPSNATLVATIEETSPAPGNYAVVSNAAMAAAMASNVYTKIEMNAELNGLQRDITYYGQLAENAVASVNGKTGNAVTLDAKDIDIHMARGYATTNIEHAVNGLDIEMAITFDTVFRRFEETQDKLPYPTNAIPYAAISGKPSLATVATSGSYNDLSNKPTIPTVPTDVSAFNNDAGYLTSYTESDPTISAWAKAASKPTYTAAEVGATTPADVTAAIREQSLGGIWDAELEVWWTPRMRNGNLTYEATTNVNLNAVN